METYTLIVGDANGLRSGYARSNVSLTPESLKNWRTNLGLSRNKLALLAGCSSVYIVKLEAGERTLQEPINSKLANALQSYEDQMQFPK